MSSNGQHDPVEDFLEIDEASLDKQWMEQPKLVYKYSKKLATKRLRMDEAKANLDLTFARIAKNIRENPSDYDIPRVSNDSVEQCTLTQDEYQAALQELNEAKYTVNLLEAAVSALEHRKRALENMVSLHGQQYFSVPRASDDSREVVEEMEKRAARSKTKKRS